MHSIVHPRGWRGEARVNRKAEEPRHRPIGGLPHPRLSSKSREKLSVVEVWNTLL